MKILIVDDHAVVRKGLAQIILEEFSDSKISETADVESMIAMVLQENFDLIICDINLPGRSGIDGLKQVKEIKPGLPVLIMSMNSADQYAIRVIKAGAHGYLNKDTVHDEIIMAIHAIKLGKKYINSTILGLMTDELEHKKTKLPHESLSNREFEVMKMLAEGKTITEIAAQLFLSNSSISTYRSRILEKTGLQTNADLTRYAIQNKLL